MAWTVPVVGLLVLLLALEGFGRDGSQTVPDDGLEAIGLGGDRVAGPIPGVAVPEPSSLSSPVPPDPIGPRVGLAVVELDEELIDLPALLKEQSAATIELVLTRAEPYRWKRSAEPIDLQGRQLRLRPGPSRDANTPPLIRLNGGVVLRDGWARIEGVEFDRESSFDPTDAALRGNAARAEIPVPSNPALRLDDGRLELIECRFRSIGGDPDPTRVAVELRATRSADSAASPSRRESSGLILECEFGSSQAGIRLVGPVVLTIRDSQFLGLAPVVTHRPLTGSVSNLGVGDLVSSLASGDPASTAGSARIELSRVVIQPQSGVGVGNGGGSGNPSPAVFDLGEAVPVLELNECRVEAGPNTGRLVLVRTDNPAGPLWRGVRNLYVGLARFLDGSRTNAPRITDFARWRDPIASEESGEVALNPRWEIDSRSWATLAPDEVAGRNRPGPSDREARLTPRAPLATPSSPSVASNSNPTDAARNPLVGPVSPPILPAATTGPNAATAPLIVRRLPVEDTPRFESVRPPGPSTPPQGSLGMGGLNLGEGPSARRLDPLDAGAGADRDRPGAAGVETSSLPPENKSNVPEPIVASNPVNMPPIEPDGQPADMDMMDFLDQIGRDLNDDDLQVATVETPPTAPTPSVGETSRPKARSGRASRGGDDATATVPNATAADDSSRDSVSPTIRDGRDLFRAIATPRTRSGERILRLAPGPLSTSGFEFKGTGRLILASAAEVGVAANRSDAVPDLGPVEQRPILMLEQGETAPRALDGFATPRGLIHVQAGELILRGLELRLSIDREGRPGIAVPFSVAPGASLRLEECLVTIAHAEEAAVIGLIPADASITMVDSDPAPARVVIRNSLIRGGGDLFNMPSGVGLRAELSQVALAGSGTLLNARGVPRDDPIPEIKVSLDRVTALTRRSLIQVTTQSAQPEPPFVEVEARSSLVTTIGSTTPLVRLVAVDDSNPFRRRFRWIGRDVGYHQIRIYRRDEIPASTEVDPNLMIDPVETGTTTDWTEVAWSQALGESDLNALHGDLGLSASFSDGRALWTLQPADLERSAEAPGRDRGADPKRLPAVATEVTGNSAAAPRSTP